MNKEERERQEKILSKLSWMNERVQLDFKGNPPPFEHAKTMQSVEKQRKQRLRGMAGEGEFLPFWHTPVPLAMEATRSDYLTSTDNQRFRAATDARTNKAGQQRIDPQTGLTEIQAALCWNAPIRHQEQLPVTEGAHSSVSVAPAASLRHRRLDPQHANTLPPQERTAAYREEILAHPMFTEQSTVTHSERWLRGTQLGEPLLGPPPRKRNGGRGMDRRNHVRLVVQAYTK